jgi:hypothetical protein
VVPSPAALSSSRILWSLPLRPFESLSLLGFCGGGGGWGWWGLGLQSAPTFRVNFSALVDARGLAPFDCACGHCRVHREHSRVLWRKTGIGDACLTAVTCRFSLAGVQLEGINITGGGKKLQHQACQQSGCSPEQQFD